MKGLIDIIKGEFPDDRITWQRGVPTFHPEDIGEAARIFKLANEYNQKLYITGFGNNIVPAGDLFKDIVAVKSDRMNQLIEVAAGDFYVEVGAGYPLRELNKNLEEYSLFLPHADLPYVGSVGGALAVGLTLKRTNDPHPVPINRFFIMGKIAVPEGEVINPGSACFKSVSGLDIVKIFSPSWGQLGMIGTATFRLTPTTARDEYIRPIQEAVKYESFTELYKNPGGNQSAIYSLKIKKKFDSNEILPLIS
jgi:FAD/FMN-containing dehydrogenase